MKKKGIRYEKAKRSIYTGGTKQKDGYAGIGGEHCLECDFVPVLN